MRNVRSIVCVIATLTVMLGAFAMTPPAGAVFPGLNGLIAFYSQRGVGGDAEIFVMNNGGGDQGPETENLAADLFPAWSPGGDKIAFNSDRSGNHDIYVMEFNGPTNRLTFDASDERHPAWSPDGTKIVFARGPAFTSDIYVMNADGSSQVNLTNTPTLNYAPSWSPDGTKIAFNRGDEIFVMNPDGTSQTNITHNAANDRFADWSSDGTKIVFSSDRLGNDEVFVMNADGSAVTPLTNNPAQDFQPVWSPDGTKIAFSSDRDGNREIYAMNADGTGQTNLTNNPAFDSSPDWQRSPSSCWDTDNPLAHENGPVSGLMHRTVEPVAGPAQPDLHDLNCTTVVPLGL